MHKLACSVSSCFLFVLILAAVGCGPPDYYTLKGKVTQDGTPLPHLQIKLAPDMLDSTRPPFAISDEEGNFEMKCGRERGVPPGIYTFHVEDPSAVDGGVTPKQSDPHYDAYMYAVERYSPYNSDLKYESDAHRSDFELKLDTKEYTSAKVENRQVRNSTDVD